MIKVKLPGVKRMEDLDIKRLEQSIEIRAFVDDKAYFKLIPISPEWKIVRKDLEKEVLTIEMEK